MFTAICLLSSLPMLPPPVRRQRAGIAQRMDLNHKNTSRDKWFQNWMCNPFVSILMRSRRFCNACSAGLRLGWFQKRIGRIRWFFGMFLPACFALWSKWYPAFGMRSFLPVWFSYHITRGGNGQVRFGTDAVLLIDVYLLQISPIGWREYAQIQNNQKLQFARKYKCGHSFSKFPVAFRRVLVYSI